MAKNLFDDDQTDALDPSVAPAPMSPPPPSPQVVTKPDQPPVLDVNPEDLRKQQADVDARKQNLRFLGGIGDNLANRKSFGEFFNGTFAPKENTADYFNQQADAIANPTDRYKKILDTYKAVQEGKDDQSLRDPDSIGSNISKAAAVSAMQTLAQAVKNNPALKKTYQDTIEALNCSSLELRLHDALGLRHFFLAKISG